MTDRADDGRRDRKAERTEAPVFDSLPRARRVQRGNDGPQPVGELIMPMMARLGLKTRARHLQVMSAWPGVVGEAVAAGAHPTSFNRGRVTVETDSPALGHQLHLQRQLIIDQLNASIGDRVVTDMRFKMGPTP